MVLPRNADCFKIFVCDIEANFGGVKLRTFPVLDLEKLIGILTGESAERLHCALNSAPAVGFARSQHDLVFTHTD